MTNHSLSPTHLYVYTYMWPRNDSERSIILVREHMRDEEFRCSARDQRLWFYRCILINASDKWEMYVRSKQKRLPVRLCLKFEPEICGFCIYRSF